MFSDHNRMKLEKNSRKITRKSSNILQPNNTLQNNPYVKEEISKEVEKKQNQHWTDMHTAYQNLWYTAEAVLKRKFVTLNAHIRKE